MPYVRQFLKSSNATYLEESSRLTGRALSKPLRSRYGSHLMRLIFFLRKLEVIIHKSTWWMWYWKKIIFVDQAFFCKVDSQLIGCNICEISCRLASESYTCELFFLCLSSTSPSSHPSFISWNGRGRVYREQLYLPLIKLKTNVIKKQTTLQNNQIIAKNRHHLEDNLSNCFPSLVWASYSWLFSYLSCLSKYKEH